MKSIFGMFDNDDDRDEIREVERKEILDHDRDENMENSTLQLRKEELDVTKDRVQSGEVILSKDIIEEKKSMDIPVIHEEVIIERRPINNEVTNTPITDETAVHIPVTQEHVEVGKHTVITEQIYAHRREVENVEHVEETLKREKARIDSNGNAEIIDNDINSIH